MNGETRQRKDILPERYIQSTIKSEPTTVARAQPPPRNMQKIHQPPR